MNAAAGDPRARAMILAAGRGERLRPWTDRTPKPLLEAGGHPLIAYGLALLRNAGFERVVVNVHHRREAFAERLGDGSRYGVRIDYSEEEELLDSGGGIRRAAPLFADGPILVMNGDVITDVPLRDLLDAHRVKQAEATLVLREDPRAASYGLVGIGDDGRVQRLRDAGSPAASVRDLMFASVQVLEKSLIESWPSDRPVSTTRELFPAMIARDAALFGWPYDGFWLTADTPAELSAVDARLRREPLPEHVRHPGGGPART